MIIAKTFSIYKQRKIMKNLISLASDVAGDGTMITQVDVLDHETDHETMITQVGVVNPLVDGTNIPGKFLTLFKYVYL